ncbi:YndM family protein [Psychrobacillus psychrodurans]|uniref:YndM family protein n=1 Tax=Psychrobacillus psychrodurans TaxID=126157 RepID=A0A9X3RAG2_9BACI|nr:YndM family protein [Psychrobacillus psychrodurans]MCZ8534555.1 YndM family protein [Psychrobacillus psychrodurans]
MYMKALFMKFLMITAVLWVILSLIYDVSFTDVLITSVLLTAVGYVGDVFILPKIGNVWAAISDFVIAYAVIYFLGSYIYEQPLALGTAAFISALILMVGELLLHRYMHTNIFEPRKSNPNEKVGYYNRTNLQTEFAEEVEIESISKEVKGINSKK